MLGRHAYLWHKVLSDVESRHPFFNFAPLTDESEIQKLYDTYGLVVKDEDLKDG